MARTVKYALPAPGALGLDFVIASKRLAPFDFSFPYAARVTFINGRNKPMKPIAAPAAVVARPGMRRERAEPSLGRLGIGVL